MSNGSAKADNTEVPIVKRAARFLDRMSLMNKPKGSWKCAGTNRWKTDLRLFPLKLFNYILEPILFLLFKK